MGDPVISGLVSLLLILGNALFVAAEYGLVAARKSRIDALARRGHRSAKILQEATQDLSRYVAGIQIGITMFGIGVGAITEPVVTEFLVQLVGEKMPRTLGLVISLILTTFVFVVVGELVPKYLTLSNAEKVALFLIRPLRLFIHILTPLVWLVQKTGGLLLKPFKIDIDQAGKETFSREELLLLVRSGTEGLLDEAHAQVIAKALRFDTLDAADIMVHRIDIKWIDISLPREELLEKIGMMSHSRIPVCRGDIDDIVGILYLQDLVKHWNDEGFTLEKVLRQVEIVPKNLTLNKIISRMREAKTQILIVVDEYGGTSGLMTLEDVVEEVFGELEDQIESERAAIEWINPTRLSARADVRYDELLEFLQIENLQPEEITTDTLATIVVSALGRMPKLGDSVENRIGTLRVENMARRRITRVAIQLKDLGEFAS